MRYDEFRARYDQVMLACLTAKLSIEGLILQIDQLTADLERLDPAGRNRAARDLANLQDILDGAQQSPHLTSPAFTEAARIFGLANAEHGTVLERVDRARDGIREIRDIAERTADERERTAILELVEPLELVIAALESDAAAR